jgi:hypothetical protein
MCVDGPTQRNGSLQYSINEMVYTSQHVDGRFSVWNTLVMWTATLVKNRNVTRLP